MSTGDGIFRWEQSRQYMEWSSWRGVSNKFFGISFSLLFRSWGYGLASGQSFTQWVVPPLRPQWCLSSAKGLPPTPNCPLIFILFLYYVLKMLSKFNIQLGVLCCFFVEGLVPSFRCLWTHTHTDVRQRRTTTHIPDILDAALIGWVAAARQEAAHWPRDLPGWLSGHERIG